MERQEFLKGALSSLTLLSVSGCFTPKLYEHHKYDETSTSFYVTEDGSKVVVVGEKYHYIFDDVSPSLKNILLSPLELRKVVIADLSNFYVRRDNVVTGDYILSLSSTASEEQRKSALDAGFVPPGPTLSGHLKGLRYSTEGFPGGPHALADHRRKLRVAVELAEGDLPRRHEVEEEQEGTVLGG